MMSDKMENSTIETPEPTSSQNEAPQPTSSQNEAPQPTSSQNNSDSPPEYDESLTKAYQIISNLSSDPRYQSLVPPLNSSEYDANFFKVIQIVSNLSEDARYRLLCPLLNRVGDIQTPEDVLFMCTHLRVAKEKIMESPLVKGMNLMQDLEPELGVLPSADQLKSIIDEIFKENTNLDVSEISTSDIDSQQISRMPLSNLQVSSFENDTQF